MNSAATSLSQQLLRTRMGKVCVAIIGASAAEMIDRATEALRDSAFLEFRLDYLEKPLTALPKLKEFLFQNSAVTAIATCRREVNGGKFKGALAAELEVLSKAAGAGFHVIDLELQSVEAIKAAELEKLRARGAALLISWHDFQATKDLDGIFERIRPHEPEFIKIVTTAKSLADNVVMLHFLERTGDMANMIGLCMGDQGVVSRVLNVRSGSAFTFAAAVTGEETAPGQMAARTLTDLYRVGQIDTATRVYGVVGNPIKHSLSPLMLNTAFHRETVNAVYLALQTAKLNDLLTVVREVPLSGLSVTMPLKQEVLKHLENMDPVSAQVGACNTIVRAHDGKLYGFTTDVGGIVRPLEKRLSLKGAKILVLGAGGAARAAVFGLAAKGAEVLILNRTPQTAQKLAREAKAKSIRRELVAKSKFDVIVNATAVGMHGVKQNHILEPNEINARLVFDLVYNPVETPLLRMAREKGIPVVTGVEMFVQQGARQFEIWTGKPAPEEEMLRVVVHALKQRAEAAH
jgi:3-dehydroquinate dehydratase / shikimate dehydrogenase